MISTPLIQPCLVFIATKTPYWRTVWRFLKKLKIELPFNPAIPLLDIYPEKNMVLKGTWPPTLIVALFTIAKIWKQPKCPLIEEWLKKMWNIYTIEYYSAMKKWNNSFYSSILQQPRDCHTEWSESDKEGEILHDITYMWNLKKKKYKCTYLQSK